MLNFKSKKLSLPLVFGLVLTLCLPVLAQAELGGSGGTAARDAAEQRAAKEKKLEKKRLLKEAEAQKGAEPVKEQPAETQKPTETKVQ